MQKIYKLLYKKIVFLLYLSLYNFPILAMDITIKSALQTQTSKAKDVPKKSVTFTNITPRKKWMINQSYNFTAQEKSELWQTDKEFDNACSEAIAEEIEKKHLEIINLRKAIAQEKATGQLKHFNQKKTSAFTPCKVIFIATAFTTLSCFTLQQFITIYHQNNSNNF